MSYKKYIKLLAAFVIIFFTQSCTKTDCVCDQVVYENGIIVKEHRSVASGADRYSMSASEDNECSFWNGNYGMDESGLNGYVRSNCDWE